MTQWPSSSWIGMWTILQMRWCRRRKNTNRGNKVFSFVDSPDSSRVKSEFVAFDRPRVVRVLERIAAELDTLSSVPNDLHPDKESNHHDPRARHRHELAEPPPKPKKPSRREQRTALRAAPLTGCGLFDAARIKRKII